MTLQLLIVRADLAVIPPAIAQLDQVLGAAREVLRVPGTNLLKQLLGVLNALASCELGDLLVGKREQRHFPERRRSILVGVGRAFNCCPDERFAMRFIDRDLRHRQHVREGPPVNVDGARGHDHRCPTQCPLQILVHALESIAKVPVDQLQLVNRVEEEVTDLGRRSPPVVESLLELLAIERRSNTAGGHGFEPQEEGGLTALEEVLGLRFAFMRFACPASATKRTRWDSSSVDHSMVWPR